jgi:hypothetical protein
MKKMMAALVVAAVAAGSLSMTSQAAQRYQKSDTTAFFMSAYMPGAGEWYNSDFQGNFPLTECLVGAICPCVHLASIIDATAGDTSNGAIRIDFWSGAARE